MAKASMAASTAQSAFYMTLVCDARWRRDYLDEIGDNQEASSIEPMRTMNADQFERFLSNEFVRQFVERVDNFLAWALTVAFTCQL